VYAFECWWRLMLKVNKLWIFNLLLILILRPYFFVVWYVTKILMPFYIIHLGIYYVHHHIYVCTFSILLIVWSTIRQNAITHVIHCFYSPYLRLVRATQEKSCMTSTSYFCHIGKHSTRRTHRRGLNWRQASNRSLMPS